jgi:hypothetical protein
VIMMMEVLRCISPSWNRKQRAPEEEQMAARKAKFRVGQYVIVRHTKELWRTSPGGVGDE